MDNSSTKGGGATQDDQIEANTAKITELFNEVERLKRLYNNVKMEVIDIRGQLPAPRKKP